MKNGNGQLKRLWAGLMAGVMLASVIAPQAVAEEQDTQTGEKTVATWNWENADSLIWDEEQQVWKLDLTLNEGETLSQDTLDEMLPDAVTATLEESAKEEAAVSGEEIAQKDGKSAAQQEPQKPDDEEGSDETKEPAASDASEEQDSVTGSEQKDVTAAEEDLSVQEITVESDTVPAVRQDAHAQPAPEEQTETLPLTWNYEKLPFPLEAGSYTVTAQLPEGYVLADDAPELAVLVNAGQAAVDPLADTGSKPITGTVSDTVSPVGTIINLFDYWLTEKDDLDNTDEHNDEGINKDHALQFIKLRGSNQYACNKYVGAANPPIYGMVAPTLTSGYPTLSGSSDVGHATQSLDYLFDPSFSGTSNQFREAHSNVKGLLQIDEDGYYYYDSTKNFAEYDEESNSFTIYNSWGIQNTGKSPQGQFFPFFDVKANYQNNLKKLQTINSTCMSPIVTHYFGLTMTTQFVQMPHGTVNGEENGTAVTYEFAGDDDVWVFIDDVLVGDLGGIHDRTALKIDFKTGKVTIKGGQNLQNTFKETTLCECFQAAGKDTTSGWNNNTFADYTEHTLKFFYLERGNSDSNMSLKFNLVSVPESELVKVDQFGSAVPGAEFSLYAANDRYEYEEKDLIATGVTDDAGGFVFTKTDGSLLRLNDLKETYGQGNGSGKFVLVETLVPDGYRKSADMHLYFPSDFDQAILLSENAWETGAYASSMVMTTLPSTPQVMSGTTNSEKISPATDLDKGTYFAVIFAKSEEGKWYPLSGSQIDGWEMVKPTSGQEATLSEVIQAAKKSNYVFALDSSGSYKTFIEDLPGDITQYYYMLLSNENTKEDAIEKAKYSIGYYYTEANTLDGADASNTVRLDSEQTDEDQLDYFTRDFSVKLYVPNIKNYLMVQKVDDYGNPLTGAVFTLYKASDDTEYDQVTTANLTQEGGSIITLEGGGVFPSGTKVLENGTYYLKESTAPDGYVASNKKIKVVVDDTGVYADAGTEDDGVSVLRGVGKIVRSMLQFAVQDDMDVTLSDITATLQRYTGNTYPQPGSGEWVNVTPLKTLNLSYDNRTGEDHKAILDYTSSTPDGPVYLEATSGWARLKITQNLNGPTTQGTKQDLKDTDLTALFSRSTVVRVENKKTGLRIEKVVTGAQGETDRDFTFALTLTDEQGNPVSQTQTYDVISNRPRLEKVKFVDGIAQIQLKHGQAVTIKGIPENYRCTVTEKLDANYTTTAQEDGQPVALQNGGVTVTVRANTVVELVFTNARIPEEPPENPPASTPTPTPPVTVTTTDTQIPSTGSFMIIPRTSDDFPYGVLIALVGISAVGLIALAVYKQKKR